jgi:hypothetical protein
MMFTERYESDADTEILYAELAAAYFQTQPTTMLWVGLNDDEQIVAHLFATIDNYYGGRFVTIHQLLKDSGEEITEEQRAEMFGALKEWGRGHGCTDIRVYAINDAVAGVFEEGYGFTRTERVMLKTPIEERKEN